MPFIFGQWVGLPTSCTPDEGKGCLCLRAPPKTLGHQAADKPIDGFEEFPGAPPVKPAAASFPKQPSTGRKEAQQVIQGMHVSESTGKSFSRTPTSSTAGVNESEEAPPLMSWDEASQFVWGAPGEPPTATQAPPPAPPAPPPRKKRTSGPAESTASIVINDGRNRPTQFAT